MKFGSIPLAGLLCIVITGCSDPKSESTKTAASDKTEKLQNGIAMGKDELADKQGVPIYPGAVAPEGRSSVTPGNGETKYVMELISSDPFKKVAAFYEQKLPKVSSICNSTGCDIIGPTPKGTLAQIKIGMTEGKTSISVVVIVEDPAKPK